MNARSKGNFDEILNIEEEMMNFFEDVMYDSGNSPLLGRIYGLCVINTSKKIITQRSLIKKFKVNPSTISRIVKELENLGLIRRKRQPGSLEWEYNVEPTTFLELLTNQLTNFSKNLPDRHDMLINIRDHWKSTLSSESKKLDKAKRDLIILESLLKWIVIVKEEMETLNERLRDRYSELKCNLSAIWEV
ncbi:MAG: MarR family transcriptional regulator [Candidatus Thorarchaeota archaeon]